MTDSTPNDGRQPWYVFDGPGTLDERLARLTESPPWRDFATRRQRLAQTYQLEARERDAVNACLYLRRPLLVTGPPGAGKSSLAHAVALDLELGDVLRWPINSRSTLTEGLYSYDAIARLRDEQRDSTGAADIGRYTRLNALGTALYGWPDRPNLSARPRVLLIDEIDKSDIDLPNDLLHALEEGEFEIPELARLARYENLSTVKVGTADPFRKGEERRLVAIEDGVVQCKTFPFILITSNGERDLPPAFFRRCLRLNLPPQAEPEHLRRMVAAHFRETPPPEELLNRVIDRFLAKRGDRNVLANDQLLNAIYLVMRDGIPGVGELDTLLDILLKELNK